MKRATNNFRSNIFRNNTFILWLSAIVSWCLSRLVCMISLQTKLKLKELRELRDRATYKEWPGNLIPCNGEYLEIHDLLCDYLEEKMKWDGSSVNYASSGIWGAIKVCSDRWEMNSRDCLTLISALEKAIVALDIYSTQHFESCSLSCSKDCDCGLTDAATKALAEIAEMLVGK